LLINRHYKADNERQGALAPGTWQNGNWNCGRFERKLENHSYSNLSKRCYIELRKYLGKRNLL